MGKIQYKIVKRKNPKNRTEEGFSASVVLYSNISATDVIDAVVRNSQIDRGVVTAVMEGMTNAFQNFLYNGHPIQSWPLGSFRPTIRPYGNHSNGVDKADDLTPESWWRMQLRYKRSPSIIAESRKVSFELVSR